MVAQSWKLVAGAVGLALVLSGCGGGGGGGGGDAPGGTASNGGSAAPSPSVPMATTLSVDFGLKQLRLSWTPVTGATTYRVQEAIGGGNFVTIDDVPGTQTALTRDIAVHQQNWGATRYQILACNTEGCSTSASQSTATGVLKAIGYFKASNTDGGDNFGWVLALSADGATLAVGAPGEASFNGDENNDNAPATGAVYVFALTDGKWAQQDYLKALHNSGMDNSGDVFGEALALSADGNTLVVGAPFEDGAATGVGGDPSLLTAQDAGAAYVFSRSGGIWSKQPIYLKAGTVNNGAYFGWSTAISGDGNTIAIGAVGDSGSAGTVRLFARAGASWTESAYLQTSNSDAGDNFGTSLAFNESGTVLAVGAPFEASGNGNPANNDAVDAGAVYVFGKSGGTWSQTRYLKASNIGAGDNFGASVALNAAGTVLAVGAPYEQSAATGVGGNENDNNANMAGAVYVFSNGTSGWGPPTYIKASNTEADGNFGMAVALSSAGDWLVVGAIGESSTATGIGGNQSDNGGSGVGAAYTFALANGAWAPQNYLKPPTAQAGSEFGSTFGVSADARTLAIGATFEGSNATGVGDDLADQANSNAPESGAVWLY